MVVAPYFSAPDRTTDLPASQGTNLVHGQTFQLVGSGFGNKATTYDNPYTGPLNWDNCSHGQAISVRWDATYPTGNSNHADDMAYRVNGFRSVNCPSLRSTGFAAGAQNGVGNGTGVINTTLIKQFTRPTNNGGSTPYMFYTRWYEQADASWNVNLGSPQDGNFKIFDYGTDYLGGNPDDSFYLGAFLTTTTAAGIGWNDDAGFGNTPNFLNVSESGSAGLGNFGKNNLNRTIVGSWVEIEAWYYAAPDNTGRLRMHTNGGVEFDAYTGLTHGSPTSTLTVNSTLDTFTNRTTRKASVGSYNRAYPGPNQYIYFSDIYQDFGEGWFFLTNNAVWGSETIREIQPYTNNGWSSTVVTFTVNGGQLPAGTVYLHFRKAPWQSSGHQALGPYTLSG